MGNLCEKLLTSCISASCDNPIYTGLDSVAYIFNRSEIDLTATDALANKDSSNPNIYKSLVMKTFTENAGTEQETEVSYTGYKIVQTGKTPFTGTQVEMVEGAAANKWNNTLQFSVQDNSPAAAMILDNLANGKFVVVIGNEYTGSDERGKFQIFGLKKGLTASAIVCEKYSEDVEGGWAVTLVEEGAPLSALFLEHLDGSTPDTDEYLESLVDCE